MLYNTFSFLKFKENHIKSPTTILIPSYLAKSDFIQSQKYHVRQQSPTSYKIQGASTAFVKLPNLTVSFDHEEPLLFEVQFDGKCYSSTTNRTWFYIHLMVNDHVLYVNKFVSNTADRYRYTDSSDAGMSDHTGGFHWFSNSLETTRCAFNDIIYLNPGLHVFDVGVRGGPGSTFPMYVFYGVFTIKAI